MNEVWSTKFGPRRVRHDPPVIAEAIAAAQGLSDDPAEQAEIAASLMGVPVEDVQSELKKSLEPPQADYLDVDGPQGNGARRRGRTPTEPHHDGKPRAAFLIGSTGELRRRRLEEAVGYHFIRPPIKSTSVW